MPARGYTLNAAAFYLQLSSTVLNHLPHFTDHALKEYDRVFENPCKTV